MARLSLPACLIDGRPEDRIEVGDRGLAYGDGVFETIAIVNAMPTLWSDHLRRLEAGCNQLGFAAPTQATLEKDLAKLELPCAGVMKVIVTRGTGGRGYAPPDSAKPRRIVQILPPRPALSAEDKGITVRWCDTRLAPQPALAGIKHLNRLEQVLARQECQADGTLEGIMCDINGAVVEATAGNLIIEQGRRWIFPIGAHCGVIGVMQSFLGQVAGQWGLTVERRAFLPDEINDQTAMYICNSLIGIVPVALLGDRPLRISTNFVSIRAYLTDQQLIAQ